MTAFDANSSDTLLNKKVQEFDFNGLVNTFNATGLSTWALSNALTAFHLSSSDSDAFGGDLAYQYGRNGNLSNVGLSAGQSVLTGTGFGTTTQALLPTATLQQGIMALS